MKQKLYYVALLIFTVCRSLKAQEPEVNYDEARVAPYELPELLTTRSGKVVRTVKEWEKIRRPEILALFEENVFGKLPSRPIPQRMVVRSVDRNALGGIAVRKEVTIYFSGQERPSMDLLLYTPAKAKQSVPVFLGLNFEGNHAVHPDPGITLSKRWMRYDNVRGIKNHYSTEASRGARSERWPVEAILARGYGLATVYQGDIERDRQDRSPDDMHALFPASKPGEWGSIAAWAWGLSRVVDYLETDKDVNAGKIAVVGHSRLGKAALWAGAIDPRFALVISNNSGEGGASLYRRDFGERIAFLTQAVPYWFCDQFKKYAHHENDLPVDAHELLALIAPRPVYVASAAEDLWADPKGEYLAAYYASPVYRLYGLMGLESSMPPPKGGAAGTGAVGYHLRDGDHDMLAFDWQHFLNFADRHFKK